MATTERDLVYPAERLQAFIAEALTALALPESDAHTCAQRMTEAGFAGGSRPGGSIGGRACARCARAR